MSKKSRPRKTRIRKASSYINNAKRQESEETRQDQINKMLAGQNFVDTWNSEYVGHKSMKGEDITNHFNNIQLEDGLIVQMYMENPIKHIARNSETKEVIHLDYYIRQIDARKRNTDVPHWVPTPFPVIDKGIVMAISPRTKMWYYEQQEKLAKYDKEAAKAMIIPKVGDVVYTKLFQFKDKRYYINKQSKCEDLVKNQIELRLKEFDFLFLIDNFDIESIVNQEEVGNMSDHQVLVDNRYIEIEPDPEPTPEQKEQLIED